MTQHVIVAGNPVDGFTFHGPFEDKDDAYLFAEGLDADWVATELTPQPGLPMIVINDDSGFHLQCPACDMRDQVIVVDIAVRENPSKVEHHEGLGFTLQIHQGQGDFQTDRYLCGNCRREVEVPAGTDEVW